MRHDAGNSSLRADELLLNLPTPFRKHPLSVFSRECNLAESGRLQGLSVSRVSSVSGEFVSGSLEWGLGWWSAFVAPYSGF